MQQLTRHSAWTDSLQTYLDRVREQPFEWGTHDCVTFACGAIKAITRVDLIDTHVGTYSTKKEAAQKLRDLGHGTLIRAVTSALGKSVHTAQAGRGDIVLRRDGNNFSLGVAVSHGWSWFVGEETSAFAGDGLPITRHGLVAIPTAQCTRAWKVAPVR